MDQYDVVALGELLIDFTENGKSLQGNMIMEANPGGAPCNVLSMLSRLGKKTAFIGKIGNDIFGSQLEKALHEVGIDTKGLKRDDTVNTTLAFVHTKKDGDREFSFYRNPGADMMLEKSDLEEDILKRCKIFHFGSLSMTHKLCREATEKAVSIAESNGAVISFDPNLRSVLWNDIEEARRQIKYGLRHCNILKISDNEIQWLTGESNYDRAVEKIQAKFNISMILLSMGKSGSRVYMGELRVEQPAYIQKNTIETTGAGDTFCACILYFVLEYGWRNYQREELDRILVFANAAASIITTRKGALRVMPSKSEIENLIAQNDIKSYKY
ncbi:MAG: carbohydrate kinase [Lachnospiraceae bacterium]|jgi:fructokinase|nr:carbohydrate kinase [Lachnospiraceae bacterium]